MNSLATLESVLMGACQTSRQFIRLHQSWNRPSVDWEQSDINHRWIRFIYSLFCATGWLVVKPVVLYSTSKGLIYLLSIVMLGQLRSELSILFPQQLRFMSFCLVQMRVSCLYFSTNLSFMVSACMQCSSLWDQSKLSRAKAWARQLI